MTRLGRTGRLAKWAGLVLLVTIAVVWEMSLGWSWRYFRSNGTTGLMLGVKHCDGIAVGLGEGSLLLGHFPVPVTEVGWTVSVAMPRSLLGELACDRTANGWRILVPLWLPFLFIGIPTAALMLRDVCRASLPLVRDVPLTIPRKVACERHAACLRCGYDLYGLPTEPHPVFHGMAYVGDRTRVTLMRFVRCPECGALQDPSRAVWTQGRFGGFLRDRNSLVLAVFVLLAIVAVLITASLI